MIYSNKLSLDIVDIQSKKVLTLPLDPDIDICLQLKIEPSNKFAAGIFRANMLLIFDL